MASGGVGFVRASLILASLAFALVASPAFAGANVWKSSIGQTGFQRYSASSGELLAGTEYESSLLPGNIYYISFRVKRLQGTVGVLVGELPVIPIEAPGDYTFAFPITEDGERRMMFQSLSDGLLAVRISRISVKRQWDATAGGSEALPAGHYWSFARERDLISEMVAPLENPDSTTRYRLNIAQNLNDALTTPGVHGFWMPVDWRTIEVGDGEYDWRLLDANMQVARDYGLGFIVKVSDRSFDGSNILPHYFPEQYVVPYSSVSGGGDGLVAKRWDRYVYQRMIRLYQAIAERYGSNPGFGGISTAETALGQISDSDYGESAYQNALIQIVTQGQVALQGRNFLFALNFFLGGNSLDMNTDARIDLLQLLLRDSLLVGGPDITPDMRGIVRSVSPYRVHARKHMPDARQYCHLQHVDQGHGGTNIKDNQYRLEYLADVQSAQESDPEAEGTYEFDDVGLHAEEVLGDLWQPQELLDFGRRNFDCQHVLWHYRDGDWWEGAVWQDIREVILQDQALH